MKAVIPAAGLGTRFLPLTKAQPKEMLPVVDKPTIQWVVEEAVNAGINDIAIITGNHKSYPKYFQESKLLEHSLEELNRLMELKECKKINNIANIEFIIQEEQKGLGHAIILCAENFVGGSPFAVLLGDTIRKGNPKLY